MRICSNIISDFITGAVALIGSAPFRVLEKGRKFIQMDGLLFLTLRRSESMREPVWFEAPPVNLVGAKRLMETCRGFANLDTKQFIDTYVDNE